MIFLLHPPSTVSECWVFPQRSISLNEFAAMGIVSSHGESDLSVPPGGDTVTRRVDWQTSWSNCSLYSSPVVGRLITVDSRQVTAEFLKNHSNHSFYLHHWSVSFEKGRGFDDFLSCTNDPYGCECSMIKWGLEMRVKLEDPEIWVIFSTILTTIQFVGTQRNDPCWPIRGSNFCHGRKMREMTNIHLTSITSSCLGGWTLYKRTLGEMHGLKQAWSLASSTASAADDAIPMQWSPCHS